MKREQKIQTTKKLPKKISEIKIKTAAELEDLIKEMAEKDNRSVNKTIDLLLQQAIKEKTRKRKNVKENNT